MKKFTIIVIMALSCLSSGAQSLNNMFVVYQPINTTTYKCFYNYDRNCSTSYTVFISEDRVVLNGTSYSLRKLGTITNSGLVFNSYAYGSDDRMLCISTESITLSGTSCGTVKGYLIMVDGQSYIARKS